VTIGDRDGVVARGLWVREVWAGSVLEATLERITFANAETGYTVGLPLVAWRHRL
jgi:hypothetical protein